MPKGVVATDFLMDQKPQKDRCEGTLMTPTWITSVGDCSKIFVVGLDSIKFSATYIKISIYIYK